MPSPASMARRSSRAQRSVTDSITSENAALKASGLYQTTTVQDRIKQWQTHGAASAPAPDAVSVRSIPFSTVSASSDMIEATRSNKENESQRTPQEAKHKKVWTTAEQLEASGRMRSQSTPRKRVVSDEHWKVKRNPKKNDSPKQPRYEMYEDGIDVQGCVPNKDHHEKSVKQASMEREERRRRRVDARSHKDHSVDVSMNKATRDWVRAVSKTNTGIDEFNQTNQSHHYMTQNNASPPTMQRSPSDSNSIIDPEDQYVRPAKQSRYAETLGRPPPSYQEAELTSKKKRFKNKTKEVLGIADPEPVYSNRLPSIEAWLDDQHDPFVDQSKSRVRFNDGSSNLPQPRRAKPNIPSPPNRQVQQASDTIEKDLSKHASRTDQGIDEYADLEQIDASPSVTLKRRGARTSRVKNRDTSQLSSNVGSNQITTPILADTDLVASHDEKCPTSTVPARLSTIASVETLQEQAQRDESQCGLESKDLASRLATDVEEEDVLPKIPHRRSTRKKRTVKERERKPSGSSIKEILSSLAEDETKFSKELITLVDGVIPVLLQCILSKSDAVAAAEFFTTSTKSDQSFSRPVIDMGIALERLRTLHSRFSVESVDSLLSWCRTAHKAYSDYLKAWRLTLQDVVINLAPLEGHDDTSADLMARDVNGDVINSNGQTVDIAYLMKRPLVNVRRLSRALSTIEEEIPNDPIIIKAAEDYRELTAAAKAKFQQETSRLEDEAAANIDATKCRDIRNMAPLPGVKIEEKSRVRARDFFDMTMLHSSGQRLDCKIDLYLRESQQSPVDSGDILICQVDAGGKWLLFPPIDLSQVSARREEAAGSLVIMVRGRAGLGQQWHELLALKTDDLQAVSEWLVMLGSNPLPPKLNVIPCIAEASTESVEQVPLKAKNLTKAALQRVPSIEDVDVPMGEPSILGFANNEHDVSDAGGKPVALENPISRLNLGGGLQKQQNHHEQQNRGSYIPRKPLPQLGASNKKFTLSGTSTELLPANESSAIAPKTKSSFHIQAKKDGQLEVQPLKSRYEPQHIPQPKPDSSAPVTASASSRGRGTKDLAEQSPLTNKIESGRGDVRPTTDFDPVQQSSLEHGIPTVTPVATPHEPLRAIAKVRGKSSSSIPLTDSIRETWSSISGFGRKTVSQPSSPIANAEVITASQRPSSAHEQSRLEAVATTSTDVIDIDAAPPPPQHKELPILNQRSRNLPTLGPSEAQKKMEREKAWHSRSPLRKEYRLSSASNSETSDTESPYTSDDDSQTSEEFPEDYHGKPLQTSRKPPTHARQPSHGPLPSLPTTGTRTLAPSDSASQGPYRRVPSSANRPDVIKKTAIAMLCYWTEKATWQPLSKEYCHIVVSPGLMEAFLIDPSTLPQSPAQQPLVAFELTPLVPLRKSTGLDISIRSPSTPDSKIKTSSNVMFRTRSAIECEAFYHMINWARLNNETYNKLARDRPQSMPPVSFNNDQPPARPRSWFGFGGKLKRQNSYRVGNIPPSSFGESQATANTTSSATSALKRLTQSSNFNVNRSSILRRPGFRTNESLYSSSNGTGEDSEKSTPPPSQMGLMPGEEGPNVPPTSDAALRGGGIVQNMKVTLQLRLPRSGWVKKGSSRLSILPAVKHSINSSQQSRPGSSDANTGNQEASSRRASSFSGPTGAAQRQPRLPSSSYTPHRLHGGGREKRVVVVSEDDQHVLLDVTLGESCFEKMSRLGIAVQVWRAEEEVRERGGVVMGQNTLYCLTFKTEREREWVFDLVGRDRYSML